MSAAEHEFSPESSFDGHSVDHDANAQSASNAQGQLYLINSPILTNYGQWHFRPLGNDEARELIRQPFESAIGHDGAANLLTLLLGVEVNVNRIAISMRPGDRAIVLRLKARLPEGQVLSVDELQQIPFELGLLTRISED